MPSRTRRATARTPAKTPVAPANDDDLSTTLNSPAAVQMQPITSTLSRNISETSTRSSASQSRAASPRFDPHAHNSLTDEDQEYHNSHRNHIYTNFIATYFLGTKALIQVPSRGRFGKSIELDSNDCCKPKFSYLKFLFGIFWVCYMIGVWYEVLIFLEKYYLSGNSPIDEIRNKDPGARYLIYVSYFALDAVYPLAFLLLLHFHSSDLLERTEKALLQECGPDVFNGVQDKISMNYRRGLIYVFLHCTVLFYWLWWTGYPIADCRFWAFIFGVPHVLVPVMLCSYVSHIIRLYTERVENFEKDVKDEISSTLDTGDKLFDAFQRCKTEGEELSNEIDLVTDWFPLILLLAIALQALAVFQFAGEWFSLIYMVQNIACLLYVVWECHRVAGTVNNLVETIVNLPTSSVLGGIGSHERANMLLTLQRPELIPHVHAFGYAFSAENFQNIILLSLGAVGSFLWNQLEEIINKAKEEMLSLPANTTVPESIVIAS